MATCKTWLDRLKWSVYYVFPRQLYCPLLSLRSELLCFLCRVLGRHSMLQVVKSGNFSEPEKEVNVLSCYVVRVKSTLVKLGAGEREHVQRTAGSDTFSQANRCKIPGFSEVKSSSGGVCEPDAAVVSVCLLVKCNCEANAILHS